MTDKAKIKVIAETVLDFLKKNNLEAGLPEVINYLTQKEDNETAFVYSPKSFNAIEKKKLINFLSELIGKNPKNVVYETDTTLIDGIKVVYKDKLWDLSLRAQVGQLARGN